MKKRTKKKTEDLFKYVLQFCKKVPIHWLKLRDESEEGMKYRRDCMTFDLHPLLGRPKNAKEQSEVGGKWALYYDVDGAILSWMREPWNNLNDPGLAGIDERSKRLVASEDVKPVPARYVTPSKTRSSS